MENQNINQEEIVETVEAPKSLEEIATETGGVLMPPSKTIRHGH